MKPEELVERGRRVLRIERSALEEVEKRLGADFAKAVELIAGSSGRVIVTGVGKSGIIARKIAATLTSTGTPAMFLHPVEGLHGDLGIVGPADVVVLLSKSGETVELFPLVEQLKRLGVHLVAIAGDRDSQLARQADAVLDTWVSEEACPHDLAPTSSTTAALAMGDALAVALLEHVLGVITAGDLTRLMERTEDFLGVGVSTIMSTTPKTIAADALASEAVFKMEQHGIMAMPVLEDGGQLVGMVHLHDLLRAGVK